MRQALARTEPLPTPLPPRQSLFWTAAKNIQRREAREAEEAREARAVELGIPEAQARWEADRDEINAKRDSELVEARETCVRSEQAARQTAENELDQLGSPPELADALEAV